MSKQKQYFAILDVGHGNSAVLIDIEGTVVIDTGPGNAFYLFLKQEGIEKLDVVLISHSDGDHIAGLLAILSCEEFTFGKVRVNSDALKESKLWDDLLFVLTKMHHTGKIDFDVSLTDRDTGAFDQGSIQVEVLAPSLYIAGRGPGSTDRKGRRLTTNSISAVIRLVKDGKPLAIFPRDLDETGLENLSDNSPDPRAPVAVFLHHGRKPSKADPMAFTREFCETV